VFDGPPYRLIGLFVRLVSAIVFPDSIRLEDEMTMAQSVVLAFGSRGPGSTPSRGKSFFVTTLGTLWTFMCSGKLSFSVYVSLTCKLPNNVRRRWALGERRDSKSWWLWLSAYIPFVCNHTLEQCDPKIVDVEYSNLFVSSPRADL
jgi:hypothetical protein